MYQKHAIANDDFLVCSGLNFARIKSKNETRMGNRVSVLIYLFEQ